MQVLTIIEYRIVKKDDTVPWVRESAIPSFDPDGKLVRIDASVYDVTELKKTEQALAEERNLLRTLIDTIPDLIYLKDGEGWRKYSHHCITTTDIRSRRIYGQFRRDYRYFYHSQSRTGNDV